MKYSEIKLAEKGARKRKQKAAKDKASYQNPNTMSESDMTDHMYNVAVNTDKTQYISFTAIDKIGINPSTAVFAFVPTFISLGVSATVPVFAFAVLTS